MVSVLKESTKGTYTWIDISGPSQDDFNAIATQYNLHKRLVEDSLQPEHLPKYETIEDVHFVILRVYSPKAPHDADTIQKVTDKIAIFIGKGFIITIHRAEFNFIDQIKKQYVDKGKCADTFDVLYRIVQSALVSYDKPLSNLAMELDLLEPTIFLQRKAPSLLQNLYYIRRKASVIARVLNLSKTILENLKGRLSSPDLNNLRDSLIRVQTSSEQTIDNVGNLLNTYISLASQRTNEVVRVLTLFSVFFMPLTFVVGIYGMNFDFMPELTWELGYPLVILFMILITLLIYLWFRRKGWL